MLIRVFDDLRSQLREQWIITESSGPGFGQQQEAEEEEKEEEGEKGEEWEEEAAAAAKAKKDE